MRSRLLLPFLLLNTDKYTKKCVWDVYRVLVSKRVTQNLCLLSTFASEVNLNYIVNKHRKIVKEKNNKNVNRLTLLSYLHSRCIHVQLIFLVVLIYFFTNSTFLYDFVDACILLISKNILPALTGHVQHLFSINWNHPKQAFNISLANQILRSIGLCKHVHFTKACVLGGARYVRRIQ